MPPNYFQTIATNHIFSILLSSIFLNRYGILTFLDLFSNQFLDEIGHLNILFLIQNLTCARRSFQLIKGLQLRLIVTIVTVYMRLNCRKNALIKRGSSIWHRRSVIRLHPNSWQKLLYTPTSLSKKNFQYAH